MAWQRSPEHASEMTLGQVRSGPDRHTSPRCVYLRLAGKLDLPCLPAGLFLGLTYVEILNGLHEAVNRL